MIRVPGADTDLCFDEVVTGSQFWRYEVEMMGFHRSEYELGDPGGIRKGDPPATNGAYFYASKLWSQGFRISSFSAQGPVRGRFSGPVDPRSAGVCRNPEAPGPALPGFRDVVEADSGPRTDQSLGNLSGVENLQRR